MKTLKARIISLFLLALPILVALAAAAPHQNID